MPIGRIRVIETSSTVTEEEIDVILSGDEAVTIQETVVGLQGPAGPAGPPGQALLNIDGGDANSLNLNVGIDGGDA
jgi:hypothetical protein